MKAEESCLDFVTLIIHGCKPIFACCISGIQNHQNSIWAKTVPLLNQTTLTRYFNKMENPAGQVNHISDGIWSHLKVVSWSRIESDWLSFDSAVITRYGDQRVLKRGYNPTKRGRPSHHPCVFLNGSKIVLNLWNQAGNTSSANNIIMIFECCYHRVSKLIKVKGVLADSGFIWNRLSRP